MNRTVYIITVKDNIKGETVSCFETFDRQFADLSFRWYVDNYMLTDGKHNLTISLMANAEDIKTVTIVGKE